MFAWVLNNLENFEKSFKVSEIEEDYIFEVISNKWVELKWKMSWNILSTRVFKFFVIVVVFSLLGKEIRRQNTDAATRGVLQNRSP